MATGIKFNSAKELDEVKAMLVLLLIQMNPDNQEFNLDKNDLEALETEVQ